uniref:profilin-2 n=1 Tax=Myxine glutinosa TaxID=7769 RepID=UPI00358E8783
MSWDAYISSLVADGTVNDAVIYGLKTRCVWASKAGGDFKSISPNEVDVLTGQDRTSLCVNGLTVAGKKCSVIRDNLFLDGDWTMDIRTKSSCGEPTYNITIGMSTQVLVCVKANKDVHGGAINFKAFKVAKYLRDLGY